MADPMTLEQFFATEAGLQLQIDMAGLSQMETATLMAKLGDAAAKGELETLDVNDAFLTSQWAEEARGEAEYHKAEQAKAVEAGDWEGAKEHAEKAEDAMLEIKEHGGSVDEMEIVEAQYDQMELDNADWHQEIADDNAASAAAYAESGDYDTAAIYADSAENAQTAANDFGAMADAGGAYGDHSVAADAGFDATATASSYDTSSTLDTSADYSSIDTTTTTE